MEACTTRSMPARRAASSTRNVPSTFTSKLPPGSCTEPITDPAAARWMIARIPPSASSSASASRMSPLTSSASTPARCAASPVVRLSSTRTRYPLATRRRTSVAPTKPAPPVTRTPSEPLTRGGVYPASPGRATVTPTPPREDTGRPPYPTVAASQPSLPAGSPGRFPVKCRQADTQEITMGTWFRINVPLMVLAFARDHRPFLRATAPRPLHDPAGCPSRRDGPRRLPRPSRATSALSPRSGIRQGPCPYVCSRPAQPNDGAGLCESATPSELLSTATFLRNNRINTSHTLLDDRPDATGRR